MYVLLLGILLLGFVLAYPILNSGIKGALNEDNSPVYTYNFTQNMSGSIQGSLIFSIYNINSTQHNFTTASNYSWISINSSTGVMTINATHNNETGNFTISIQVLDDSQQGTTVSSEFIVNATNDAPNFTNIKTEYNLTQDITFLDYINATDEEEHYPLVFNISFVSDNCSHATWSGRNANQNCSLYDFGFNMTNIPNISASMNFTPAKNDVGTYWANISVMDYGNSTAYGCPHAYCDNSTYRLNKTTYYSRIVKFNVFSTLEINVTNCQNKIFQENQSNICQINITTKGENSQLNISSLAILKNFNQGNVSNITWFYANNTTTSSNFTLTINVNVTPKRTEVGNWTINFSVKDTFYNQNSTQQIYIYVNRTFNDVPDLVNITNFSTSIDLEKVLNLTVYDDDLLIPDKNDSFGGYNETITFNVTIYNQSNLDQIINISNFTVTILNMPVSGTNRTKAEIRFTPNSSQLGDYKVNITVRDKDASYDSEIFNMSIVSNQFPVWNQTSYSFNLTVNSSFTTTASFGPINLTGEGYVNDTGDTLTFTNDSSAMPRFNLSSNGMIVFTPWKQDVGYWSFSVTAIDGLGLQNTTTFSFNITNVNSDPVIETPISVTNASVDANSNVIAQENNYTIIDLFIQDEDFKISSSQKSYYNESLSINLTIQGNNSNLFSFVINSNFPSPGNNRSKYSATFTPNETDVGSYNVTINVTDATNSSDVLKFNLTINGINDAPVLIELTNQTSAVNRSFYYDINATDEEDGNDTQGNLVFTYNFTSGRNIFNTTIFNSTSGKINITFNSSQGGKYKINISVNDSSNLMDSREFWIYVYDTPNITYPASGENFSLQENVTSNLTFRGNHSIQDNLTYGFYINNVLKYNLTYYGNDTNLTWQFTPNFTDETYGQFQNLTLVIYATDSSLENGTDLNHTMNWNVNISHTNFPVNFSGYIGDQQTNYDNDITINLSQYFSDIDYNDVHYNQTINFTVSSNSTPSSVSSTISNWTLILSSSTEVAELLTITANDSSTIVTSGSFEVTFTTPTTTPAPSPSGGGGGRTIPVSLKIIMPDPVSLFKKDRIVLPITLYNSGENTLSDINLTSIVVKNNLVRNDIALSLDKSYFSSLATGKKENVTLTLNTNTDEIGTFEITINADVKSPKYNDWGKLYLTVKENEAELIEKLLFTEEFLAENPECIELEELLDEAREYFKKGDFTNTVLKITQAINGCKNAISQQARAKRKEKTGDELYQYLPMVTIAVFVMGIGYYSYRRMRLKRTFKDEVFKKKKS